MKNLRLQLMLVLLGFLSFGTKAQFLDEAKKFMNNGSTGFTEKDAADAIKEALVKGTGESVKVISQVNGYLSNVEIKIPFPENAREIESKLRSIGLGNKVDEFIVTMNHAAEEAAKEAEPIFVGAIKGMTVNDAIQIVKGKNDAATQYLARTTTPALKIKFMPVIKSALDKVDATRMWKDLVDAYNQIPFVKRQNPDLPAYVTDKAINGAFIMIAKEELKIRQNPVARTTELLKKVFGG